MTEHFKIAPQVHARSFDGETVVLDLTAGKYFSLDEVGAAIWDALTSNKTQLEEIVQHVVAAYEVDAATAETDVRAFLAQLCASGLIVRV
jgi:hypothetical protein